jgi:hypothetical protein
MARKRKSAPLPLDRGRLEGLPQRFDVWQVDARQIAASVRVGDHTVRPWMVVVVSRTDDQVLAFELSPERPTVPEVWQTLLKAMQEPAAGEPHRPSEVQVPDQQHADALRPSLQAVNVECTVAEALDEIDEVYEELSSHLQMPGQGPPGLLEMPGMTPEAVGSFFDAAALYYEQAPWKKVGERPVRVECDRFTGGPWFAVLMGQGGMTSGLALYDSLQNLHRIQRGELSDEESARLTSALAVVFGDRDDLPAGDLEAAAEHGWRVAGPRAYPSVYRMEPGLRMRSPLAWELELLESCLRAVPQFVRKKTRRLEPFSITVPVASGELPLVLSWAEE